MVIKLLLFFSLVITTTFANPYKTNCIACHKKLPVSIDKYFYRYLLKYSSERSVKGALSSYLKTPSKEKTIMPDAFVSRFGIKKPTKLSDNELKEAIDYYWNTYKVFGKLK